MTTDQQPRKITPTMVETASGRFVDLANPDPQDICIEDVAHHLSMICRFTGATARFFSVAEHSVNVSLIAEGVANLNKETCSGYTPDAIRSIALYALLHDAHEAFVGDDSRPKKRADEDDRGYEDTALDQKCPIARETQIAAIKALVPARLHHTVVPFDHFDLDQIITAADNRALRREAESLMRSKGRGWIFSDFEMPFFEDAKTAGETIKIEGFQPSIAYVQFIARYCELTTIKNEG